MTTTLPQAVPQSAPTFQPVPRKSKRGWTPQTQAAFIALLAATGSVAIAARRCGMSREGAYLLRAAPGAASFAAAWDEAVTRGISALKAAAIDRAINGTTEAVWHAGKQVGTRTRYNNQLTMRLLTHYDRQTPTPQTPTPSSENAPQTLPPEIEALLSPAIEARLEAKAKGNTTPASLALNTQWAEGDLIKTNFSLLGFIEIVRHWLKEGPEHVSRNLDRLEQKAFDHPPTARIIRRELTEGRPLDQSTLNAAKTRLHAARVELYVKAGYID